MRDDMFEVIIERPRRGSRMGHHRRARRRDAKVDLKRDPDGMPLRIGIGRAALMGRGIKTLNENLAPLRRYLDSQANRPWDKVWSDICANLSTTSTVQQHVRDHIVDFVAINLFMKDGVLHGRTRYGDLYPVSDLPYRLYVDPRTGILRKNKHYGTWSRRRREEQAAAAKQRAARMREISPTVQVHKLDDDCWWEVHLAPIPKRAVTHPSQPGCLYLVNDKFTDVVKRAKLSALPIAELYGKPDVYAAAKRQLSRKEIRDLRLKAQRAP